MKLQAVLLLALTVACLAKPVKIGPSEKSGRHPVSGSRPKPNESSEPHTSGEKRPHHVSSEINKEANSPDEEEQLLDQIRRLLDNAKPKPAYQSDKDTEAKHWSKPKPVSASKESSESVEGSKSMNQGGSLKIKKPRPTLNEYGKKPRPGTGSMSQESQESAEEGEVMIQTRSRQPKPAGKGTKAEQEGKHGRRPNHKGSDRASSERLGKPEMRPKPNVASKEDSTEVNTHEAVSSEKSNEAGSSEMSNEASSSEETYQVEPNEDANETPQEEIDISESLRRLLQNSVHEVRKPKKHPSAAIKKPLKKPTPGQESASRESPEELSSKEIIVQEVRRAQFAGPRVALQKQDPPKSWAGKHRSSSELSANSEELSSSEVSSILETESPSLLEMSNSKQETKERVKNKVDKSPNHGQESSESSSAESSQLDEISRESDEKIPRAGSRQPTGQHYRKPSKGHPVPPAGGLVSRRVFN